MSAPNISVTLPVSQAIDRVKLLLFRPFDPGKWFAIGFCAWLAFLGEGGGGGGGGNFNFGQRHGRENAQRELEHAWHFVLENLYWIVPVAIALAVVGIVLGVALTWLSSRGRFMFLNCVALNRADIADPWNRYSRQGNSLFLFRLVLGLIGAVLVLPALGGITLLTYQMALHDAWNIGGIAGIIGIGFWFVFVSIVFALVLKLTTDFVVPIMFLRGSRTMEAWREFRKLLGANLGHFVLYILFYILLDIAIGVMIVAVVIVTCCIAGCLFAIPYLGTVLLLPLLVFKRAYSLHFLAQFGPAYDVFPPAAPPVA